MKIYLLTIFFLVNACVTSNIANKTGIESIRFGSGGGFTGVVKTYTLSSDSKVSEKDKLITIIKKEETLAIFNQAKELKDFEWNEPENIYSFIEIITKDKTNRIVWGGGSSKVDKKIVELYKNLTSSIK
jgi:hypothetical protein